jgi:hypothetical protein
LGFSTGTRPVSPTCLASRSMAAHAEIRLAPPKADAGGWRLGVIICQGKNMSLPMGDTFSNANWLGARRLRPLQRPQARRLDVSPNATRTLKRPEGARRGNLSDSSSTLPDTILC